MDSSNQSSQLLDHFLFIFFYLMKAVLLNLLEKHRVLALLPQTASINGQGIISKEFLHY